MVVKVWVTPRPDSSSLSSAEKDALIATLLARIDELGKRFAVLEVENAALRAKLDLPPKTPDNSSTPPSQGRKASSATTTKPKGKPHVGAHRPLHPNPTRHRNVPAMQCQHCGRDVTAAPQTACETYDRIEIPEIKPDVTRVTLYGGTCPCCAQRVKAGAPAGPAPRAPRCRHPRAPLRPFCFSPPISLPRPSPPLSPPLPPRTPAKARWSQDFAQI